MKVLFREAGLPVAPYLVLDRDQWFSRQNWWLDQVREKLGYPAFVKPSNLGSSVGISKAYNPEELIAAVGEALRYDHKLLIEQHVAGREIECGVIGNRAATASRPGEVIPCNDFYDYRAKYLDDRSGLVVPVELGPELENMIKDYSVRAFQAIEADGLARVDFFLSKSDHRIIVNEINTMPGFTSISMYPKMFEASGLDYNALVDRLLELAEERHQNRQSLLFAPPE